MLNTTGAGCVVAVVKNEADSKKLLLVLLDACEAYSHHSVVN